jgi:hypothetical protein
VRRELTRRIDPVFEPTWLIEERSWLVVFQPLGPSATAVQVLRGENDVWVNAAEQGMNRLNTSDIVAREARATPIFVRDRERELAVAVALEGHAAVEVGDARSERAPQVAPLLDPPAPPASPQSSAAQSCRLEAGPIASMLAPGHIVLLSDPLGAEEPWGVIDELRCLAEARGLPVTIALSISTDEQAALNHYLGSPGTDGDRRTLLSGPFWSRLWQDGRSSAAVVDAIERVRSRREHGVPVALLAVDSDVPGNPRQAHVASMFLRHRKEAPGRLIVGLLGNVLTSRRVGAAWDEQLLPVGARLAAVLPEYTHTFDVSFWRGAHWSCHLFEQGHLKCGTWPLQPGPAQWLTTFERRPFFRVFPRVSEYGFDGIYFVGQGLTPSPPAVESMRVDEGAGRDLAGRR